MNINNIKERIRDLEVKRHEAFGVYTASDMRNSFFREKAKGEMIECQKEIMKLRWGLKYGR